MNLDLKLSVRCVGPVFNFYVKIEGNEISKWKCTSSRYNQFERILDGYKVVENLDIDLIAEGQEGAYIVLDIFIKSKINAHYSAIKKDINYVIGSESETISIPIDNILEEE